MESASARVLLVVRTTLLRRRIPPRRRPARPIRWHLANAELVRLVVIDGPPSRRRRQARFWPPLDPRRLEPGRRTAATNQLQTGVDRFDSSCWALRALSTRHLRPQYVVRPRVGAGRWLRIRTGCRIPGRLGRMVRRNRAMSMWHAGPITRRSRHDVSRNANIALPPGTLWKSR